MAVMRIDAPSATQAAFFADRHKYVAFGGARGGGKSWAVRQKAKLLCVRYPGIRVLIVRRTYKELVNNHVVFLRSELHGIARYNETKMVFTFPNGSTINFGYFNADKDASQYQGSEYDAIFVDEATTLQEEWLKKLTASLRGVNDFPKRVYYTCNPGGVSHGYIKRLFVDRAYEKGERAEDYSFIRSRVTDNLALMRSDPDYIRQLEALPPKIRRAWLDGDWDIFEGQYFEEFVDAPDHYEDRVWTHVIKPFEPIPKEWTIYRSFDFGYAKPFSCAWWAVDYDGRLYRILELYGCTETPNEGVKWEPDRIFQEIAKIEKEHRWLKGRQIHGVADPSIWDGSRGPSVADMAARCGVYFAPGDNARLPGWMQVHYRLAFDEDGRPGMQIFNTCKAFIRTMPLLQYDEHRVEDLDTTGEDHVADEVRYMCMARPMKPIKAAKPERKPWNPLDDDTRYKPYGWARL
ncbi:MAG: phage terminase large subunit [Clostridia bacterium]|nr:phage terminase large subunit [Clostridia bacterium]